MVKAYIFNQYLGLLDPTFFLFFRYNRNRFSLPYDLLNYRYNLFRQGTRQQGTDAIFDPIGKSKY